MKGFNDGNRDYNDIIKSNLIFGGIKVFQMILTFVRTKIVSVILGPNGMGIQSLFNSTLLTLHQFTTFGIYTSAVREISASDYDEDKKNVIIVFEFLVFFFGSLGAIIILIFSGLLSRIVFGNEAYKLGFIILSIALILESVVNGLVAIFQGLRKLAELAKGSLIGAVLSILFSVPILYLFREEGIPYSIVFSFLATALGYSMFSKSIKIFVGFKNVKFKVILKYGIPIVRMGFLLMFSSGLMTIFSLVLNSFINRYGSTIDVGLYSAAITLTYGSITIFTSILASDYFPRLSSIKDNKEFNQVVNNQIELLILVLTPIVVAIVFFTKYIVILLFSVKFLPIIPLVKFMSISLMLRVVWQSFSYIILSKGDQKRYLIFDTFLGNGSLFLMNLCFYYYYGLIGLSISYLVGAFFMVVLLYSIVYYTYQVKINRNVFFVLILMFSFCIIAFFLSNYLNLKYGSIVNGIWLIIVFFTSFIIINRKSNLTKKLHEIFKNWK